MDLPLDILTKAVLCDDGGDYYDGEDDLGLRQVSGIHIGDPNDLDAADTEDARDDTLLRTWLAKGGNVNETDKNGRTPLFYVRNAKEARILIAAGADVNAKDKEGKTPLHYISSRGYDDTYLYRDNYSNTSIQIIKTLIKYGANVNALDKDGRTPIFYSDNKPTTNILLELGAAGNIKDTDGVTPIVYRINNTKNFSSRDFEKYDSLFKVLMDADNTQSKK